jgi:hypothetical protein
MHRGPRGVRPPSARAMADELPPPMAPADIICISITAGSASATPASASVPSLPTKWVSIRPTDAYAIMTSTMGTARFNSVVVIAPRAADASAAPITCPLLVRRPAHPGVVVLTLTRVRLRAKFTSGRLLD